MKTYEFLKIEIQERIAIVTINRPKALNAINQQLMNEIGDFFENEIDSLDVMGVIIIGEGEKAFVAGADISEFIGLEIGDTLLSRRGHEAFMAIEMCSKPVIAAVNGFALGGGCELAMACHIRVASVKARFGTPEVNLGIIPGFGGTQRLTQLVGKGKALELLMTGDMINAEEALSIRLVNHVVAEGEVINKSKKILHKIGTKAPLAISKIIATVNTYFDKTKNGYEEEIQNFGYLTETEDFKEGAAAFLEKRKAEFKGN